MNKFARNIILFMIALMNISQIYSQIQTKKNEDILYKILISPLFEQITESASKENPLYFSLNAGNSLSDRWVNQILIDSCVSAGYSVYFSTDTLNASGSSVGISNTIFDISYRPVDKKWFFLTKNYERNVNCSVHISILDSLGKVILSEQINNSYQDKFKKNDVKHLENDSLPFTKGNLKESNFGKKILEPVLITTATLTVVYLFYSLRSGN